MRCVAIALLWASASAVWADAGTDREARAREHYTRGRAAFELARFREALKEYERAYKLTPLPGFLFNIGQCYRNLGHKERAIFFFRQYLRKRPRAQNRAAVEQLVEDLEREVAAAAARREQQRLADEQRRARLDAERRRLAALLSTTQPATQPVTTRPIYKRWWFWTIIAVAAAGGGAAGIYFGTRRSSALPDGTFPVWDLPRP